MGSPSEFAAHNNKASSSSSTSSRANAAANSPPENVLENAPEKAPETAEKERDIEPPEGSVDTSPTSEQSSSNSSPPSYAKWQENLSSLLDDLDGLKLFNEYLTEEGVEDVSEFWHFCNGLKKAEQNGQLPSTSAGLTSMFRLIYFKRFRNKVECTSEEARREVECELSRKSANLDASLFDRLQVEVFNYMDSRLYPNFLKSDLLIQYIQQQEQQRQPSQLASLRQSGTLSTASSTSGCQPRVENKVGSTSSLSSATTLEAQSKQNQETSYSSEPLDPVDENKELNVKKREQRSGSLLRSQGFRSGPLFSTSASSSASGLERFPSSGLDPRLPSAPYHAKQSTYNPVSRNDSELQSQSSGAMGGETFG